MITMRESHQQRATGPGESAVAGCKRISDIPSEDYIQTPEQRTRSITSELDLSDDSVVMTAELAKPDSMEDLDKDDEEEDYHEHYADDHSKHEDEEAEVEKRSLLTEDQKQGSSPSILLATATQNTNNDTK